MAGKIFVNYRREDAKGEALALRTVLAAKLPRCDLFMDVDGGIKPGSNYVRVLDERVAGADVFLCLIGPRWLDVTDAAGKRRLDTAEDFVRIEIASALKRDIPIIPILVDDTGMPAEQELPEQIRLMAYKQAMRLRHDRFNADAEGIARAVRERLSGVTVAGVSRWLLVASVLAALGLGATAGPAAMKLAGMDAHFPLLGLGDMAALRNRVETLEADNASLAASRSETASLLQARMKEAEAANGRVASLTSDLTKARADLKRLEDQGKQSADAAARVRQLEGQLVTQTKRIESLETEKSAAEKARSEAQASLQARQKEVSDGATKVRQLESQVSTLTKRVETLEAEKASADKARGEAQAALQTRTKEVEGLTSQLSAANAALGKARQEIASLEKREQRQSTATQPSNLQLQQVIARRGQWASEHKINFTSNEPNIFKHFYIVVASAGHVDSGAIVTGDNWDQSTYPGWKTVYGHCRECTGRGGYIHASLLTYLGPSWRPEFEELSNEVRKILGGDQNMRFIRYGGK